MKLPETFVCEVCGDELPCLGFEPRRATRAQRSSEEYPNKLCAWCWDETGETMEKIATDPDWKVAE